MDSVCHRILALLKIALVLVVQEVFGDDDEMEKFLINILWKGDDEARRTSLLKLLLLEFVPSLGGNTLFCLCKMLIPLSFDSRVIRYVVRWTLVHLMKHCFTYGLNSFRNAFQLF
ncbi:hypothetical protein SLEP1_g32532 [Rubroshorea leprosula]|uniref:Uncharacterized protein n=1 Tax=Rubroshorea leprosula TaxID=152421 RepID=A0AAV5KDR5_9ROSI|nr:hypothetical protein SLEP1_g32532 [Rubroshorea leprosula]